MENLNKYKLSKKQLTTFLLLYGSSPNSKQAKIFILDYMVDDGLTLEDIEKLMPFTINLDTGEFITLRQGDK